MHYHIFQSIRKKKQLRDNHTSTCNLIHKRHPISHPNGELCMHRMSVVTISAFVYNVIITTLVRQDSNMLGSFIFFSITAWLCVCRGCPLSVILTILCHTSSVATCCTPVTGDLITAFMHRPMCFQTLRGHIGNWLLTYYEISKLTMAIGRNTSV